MTFKLPKDDTVSTSQIFADCEGFVALSLKQIWIYRVIFIREYIKEIIAWIYKLRRPQHVMIRTFLML